MVCECVKVYECVRVRGECKSCMGCKQGYLVKAISVKIHLISRGTKLATPKKTLPTPLPLSSIAVLSFDMSMSDRTGS